MLDLTRQYETIKDEVHAAIERVLTTQHFIGGPELEGFERESASYLGVKESVGCASGTDACWLALAVAGVGREACVITTPFSFFATVSSIVRCGATPILADIDPATLNLDPEATERALQRGRSYKLRAVMPVHLYGQCGNIYGINISTWCCRRYPTDQPSANIHDEPSVKVALSPVYKVWVQQDL